MAMKTAKIAAHGSPETRVVILESGEEAFATLARFSFTSFCCEVLCS